MTAKELKNFLATIRDPDNVEVKIKAGDGTYHDIAAVEEVVPPDPSVPVPPEVVTVVAITATDGDITIG